MAAASAFALATLVAAVGVCPADEGRYGPVGACPGHLNVAKRICTPYSTLCPLNLSLPYSCRTAMESMRQVAQAIDNNTTAPAEAGTLSRITVTALGPLRASVQAVVSNMLCTHMTSAGAASKPTAGQGDRV